jgi:hypothetical protein
LTDLDDELRGRLAALKAQRDRAESIPERVKEHSGSQIEIAIRR